VPEKRVSKACVRKGFTVLPKKRVAFSPSPNKEQDRKKNFEKALKKSLRVPNRRKNVSARDKTKRERKNDYAACQR